MELDVDHVNDIDMKYHGHVGVYIGSIQKNRIRYQPPSQHGMILVVWMQGIELHQLGLMGETSSTLEKCYGQ